VLTVSTTQSLYLKKGFPSHVVKQAALLRLLLSLVLTSCIALILNYISYDNYYGRTIFRTQTVDFNILAHTLPFKLSTDLVNNDLEDIKQTMDSNYGLFGLLLTDCKIADEVCGTQKAIHIATGKYNPNPTVDMDSLKGSLYSVLRDPPPIKSEWSFESPRDLSQKQTGVINHGKIIGRVYYLRKKAPPFLDEIKKWLSDITSSSSLVLLYNSIALSAFLTTFSIWLLIEFSYYRTWVAETKVREAQQIASIEREQRLAALEQTVAIGQVKLSQERELLEAQAKLERQRAFLDAFREIVNADFASVVNNITQEIAGILYQLKTNVDDIIHDLIKAPLLSRNGTGYMQEDLASLVGGEQSEELTRKAQLVNEHIYDIDETVKTINWVMKDLEGMVTEPSLVSIATEVRKFYENLPPKVKGKFDIEFISNLDEEILIKCNPWHVRKIVKNAVYNACASLEMYTLYKRAHKSRVVISCVQKNLEVAIRIEDNGMGFDKDTINSIYESEEKVKKASGTGMGSLIVRAYLLLHGGRVEKANKSEGGAVVTFLFPIVEHQSQ
jgi:signal transduction histidine kinase